VGKIARRIGVFENARGDISRIRAADFIAA
jgi:hypothetical protein